ncbi:glutathione-disulfide reductase [Isoalcanivorax indicus]|uniref:glutathione-disulfide reductase n=1 Tax=Isoalcanivorax indicus TaxID=2202653 RepID=UPI000DB90655|nr:glutathione-disulfide reductase [Isoalcanivorax indicus]
MYDLIVIGAGSGGVRAARIAAGLGARVAIVESRFFGGTCVNVGCVPKKLFAYASEFPGLFAQARDFGFEPGQGAEARPDWARLRDNKTRAIERLNGIYERMLEQAGVEVFVGHGRIEAAGSVSVTASDGARQLLSGRHLLIATGGKPHVPDVPGHELALISDDLFFLPDLPRRVAVVGGGYIATEFASILQGLGVEVQQLYRGDLFLRGFDDDIRRFVAEQMRERGVALRFNTDVTAIRETPDGGRLLTLADGSHCEVDAVFYATGRVPNIDDLFAPGVDIARSSNGALSVDAGYATSLPGLYAVGDVTDRVQLTPVALAEGMWLARALFGQDAQPDVGYENIPTAVFCQPNIGTVGLTEAEAQARYGSLRIYLGNFRPLRYSLGDIQHRSLVKLVVDDATDRVVGLHMAGDEAGEIVQGFAVAVNMGATKADFDRTLGIHPTSAEEFVTLREVARRVPPAT